MKRKRFRETQSSQILKEAEAGVAVPDLCRRDGFPTGVALDGRGMVTVDGHTKTFAVPVTVRFYIDLPDCLI